MSSLVKTLRSCHSTVRALMSTDNVDKNDTFVGVTATGTPP